MLKNTVATAMIGAGLVTQSGIPVDNIPSIVHNYWQERIAPTPKQELTRLAIKHRGHAKKGVLDTETIPDEKDRHRFRQLQIQLARSSD